MDSFKRCQMKHTGVGGFKCPCCNYFFGKDKNKLNRMARASLKGELRKEIKFVLGLS